MVTTFEVTGEKSLVIPDCNSPDGKIALGTGCKRMYHEFALDGVTYATKEEAEAAKDKILKEIEKTDPKGAQSAKYKAYEKYSPKPTQALFDSTEVLSQHHKYAKQFIKEYSYKLSFL